MFSVHTWLSISRHPVWTTHTSHIRLIKNNKKPKSRWARGRRHSPETVRDWRHSPEWFYSKPAPTPTHSLGERSSTEKVKPQGIELVTCLVEHPQVTSLLSLVHLPPNYAPGSVIFIWGITWRINIIRCDLGLPQTATLIAGLLTAALVPEAAWRPPLLLPLLDHTSHFRRQLY